MLRKSETLCVEVVMHETKGTSWEQVCGRIDVASISGA